MITRRNKRLWGLEPKKRIRRNVYMREEANRLTHTGPDSPGRKIALVGTADSGSLAPIDDEKWEIWGVGGRREWMTRANRWYEVHRLAGNSETWIKNWRAQALTFNGEVDIYMHYPEPGFGDRVYQYPAEHIMQRFGTHFLTSSFSWMMAHAIDEMCPVGEDPNLGEIAIYGVDMEAGSEYRQQKMGFLHFMDLARVLGIRMTRLASSGISYEPIPYPMWQDDPLMNKLDKRQTKARDLLIDLDETKSRTEIMIAQNAAVIAALKEHAPEASEIESLEKEIANLTASLKTTTENLIYWDGVEDEQQWLRDYLT